MNAIKKICRLFWYTIGWVNVGNLLILWSAADNTYTLIYPLEALHFILDTFCRYPYSSSVNRYLYSVENASLQTKETTPIIYWCFSCFRIQISINRMLTISRYSGHSGNGSGDNPIDIGWLKLLQEW